MAVPEVGRAATAEALGVPRMFNLCTYFIDRHLIEGRSDKVAIEFGNERITYGAVAEAVNRFASALSEVLCVRAEERVALLLVDSPAFVYAFFGSIRIGAVPVPLNTFWLPSECAYALDDSRARVLVISEDLVPTLKQIPPSQRRYLREIVVVGGCLDDAWKFDDLLAKGCPAFEVARTNRDDAAFWLYSSGTTGMPKACVHLQHDMVVNAELYGKQVLRITENDRFFSVARLFFAYGLGNAMYLPFSTGGTTILWSGAPSAADVFSIIERYRPTLFFSVPAGYAMMLAHRRRQGADFDLSSIRVAYSSGEALPESICRRFAHRFGLELTEGLGSTEVLHFLSNPPGHSRPGSSGRLVPGYEARLVADDGRDVSVGEVGHLLVSGDSTCAFYWNRHDETRSRIEGRWIRTGDRLFRDADGLFWYAGRSDDMLKIDGMWVSPLEIENELLKHPCIAECAVVGCPDADGLPRAVAFVVVMPGITELDDLATDLKRSVRSSLGRYKSPNWIRFVARIPRTPSGKIQRYKLRAEFWNMNDGVAHV